VAALQRLHGRARVALASSWRFSFEATARKFAAKGGGATTAARAREGSAGFQPAIFIRGNRAQSRRQGCPSMHSGQGGATALLSVVLWIRADPRPVVQCRFLWIIEDVLHSPAELAFIPQQMIEVFSLPESARAAQDSIGGTRGK